MKFWMPRPGLLLWITVFMALVFSVMSLPDEFTFLRPFWLAIVVIYWQLEAPRRMGLGKAFFIGLLGDIVTGGLLGEQALRLLVTCFIVARFRSRIRFFPVPQQAATIGLLLLNDRVVWLILNLASGHAWPDFNYWLSPLLGAAIWPILFYLFDEVRFRLVTSNT